MLKTIKSLYNRCKYRFAMRGYIKELKKPHTYIYTAEDAFYEFEERKAVEKMTIERITNQFVVDVPEQGIESIVGDNKASFVSYNGVPYNKQK